MPVRDDYNPKNTKTNRSRGPHIRLIASIRMTFGVEEPRQISIGSVHLFRPYEAKIRKILPNFGCWGHSKTHIPSLNNPAGIAMTSMRCLRFLFERWHCSCPTCICSPYWEWHRWNLTKISCVYGKHGTDTQTEDEMQFVVLPGERACKIEKTVLVMAALCNRGAIIFLLCDFYLSIYFLLA